MASAPRLLILETSHQPGLVALAEGPVVLATRRLDEARRHARDLVPAARDLLAAQGWKARDLDGVIVSQGPGSYTGLRVGLMSAKTLAYATGCALLGVETFAAIARQAPPEAPAVAVLADAQQGKVYVQEFGAAADGFRPARSELTIRAFDEWCPGRPPDVWVSGTALEVFASRLPADRQVVIRSAWTAGAESLLALGLAKLQSGAKGDPFALDPIYLRPSSAEEKWRELGRP